MPVIQALPAGAAYKALQRPTVVFWDFDGVIKDSVEVKSMAFERLFAPYGSKVSSMVRRHHEANGGVSRYEKMPLYLEWAGEPNGADQVGEWCMRFSALVLQAVIDAPWVPGVREYLEAQSGRQHFVLVTATPDAEMRHILHALGLMACFREVYGAPMSKADAIRDVLERLSCAPSDALVVGDSESDVSAAAVNGVSCLLRCTTLNEALQQRHTGPMFGMLPSGKR